MVGRKKEQTKKNCEPGKINDNKRGRIRKRRKETKNEKKKKKKDEKEGRK